MSVSGSYYYFRKIYIYCPRMRNRYILKGKKWHSYTSDTFVRILSVLHLEVSLF